MLVFFTFWSGGLFEGIIPTFTGWFSDF